MEKFNFFVSCVASVDKLSFASLNLPLWKGPEGETLSELSHANVYNSSSASAIRQGITGEERKDPVDEVLTHMYIICLCY